ncbi:hypothetical protein JOB18_000439 [Solea senegalensis]|uniref:Uncharacterized protein n=1 Tax=Solea senegalensis TaxID=28829 RepID=A0AAV6R8X8_SOLSE|nr:hypothetical protein JOB18_000439 [Solea senegalensis]
MDQRESCTTSKAAASCEGKIPLEPQRERINVNSLSFCNTYIMSAVNVSLHKTKEETLQTETCGTLDGEDCVVGCALRSSVRQAAAAITRCAQLCVQVMVCLTLHAFSIKTTGSQLPQSELRVFAKKTDTKKLNPAWTVEMQEHSS